MYPLCALSVHVDDFAVPTLRDATTKAVHVGVAAWAELAGALRVDLRNELDRNKHATIASSAPVEALPNQILGRWYGDDGMARSLGHDCSLRALPHRTKLAFTSSL